DVNCEGRQGKKPGFDKDSTDHDGSSKTGLQVQEQNRGRPGAGMGGHGGRSGSSGSSDGSMSPGRTGGVHHHGDNRAGIHSGRSPVSVPGGRGNKEIGGGKHKDKKDKKKDRKKHGKQHGGSGSRDSSRGSSRGSSPGSKSPHHGGQGTGGRGGAHHGSLNPAGDHTRERKGPHHRKD
ncbi:unnamed protein product, partial [Didymodactylos carnosus]